jgi:hypothetical protein
MILKKDVCPEGDDSPSYYDGTCANPTGLRGSGEATEDFVDTNEHKTSPTPPYEGGQDDLQSAYQRAFQQGITTMLTFEEARTSDTITRAEMAKMVVKYVA